ncbi:MAG: hypothetical protein OFPII_42920 [Osedax symbiont Rs1]|nr:MAG: hypothetical protein OFPII_42920 [Osedax symbiont Rs1]
MSLQAKILPPLSVLEPKIKTSRYLAVICYFLLLISLTLWYLVLYPIDTAHPWVIWLLHFLPLAAFIKVIQTGNPRGHAWLCFLLIMYFNEAVLAATTVLETRWLGIFNSFVIVILFISAMMYARWAGQYKRHPDRAKNT